MKIVETKLGKEEMRQNVTEKKKWIGLDGNPTSDDTATHWDEDGFLDIRESVDGDEEEVKASEKPAQEKPVQVATNEPIREFKSPADLRKLMEDCEARNKHLRKEEVKTAPPVAAPVPKQKPIEQPMPK